MTELYFIISIVIIVAAVAGVAAVYVRGVKANLKHAGDAAQAELKSKEDQIENLRHLYEEKLNGKDEAMAGLEKNYQAQLKAKDDYIDNLNKVHTEALRKADEVHAESLKKSDEVHAEALKKSEAVHAEAARKADEVHAEAIKKLEAQQAQTLAKIAEQHVKDMELMQSQFKTAAGEILSKNTQDFSQSSSEKIDALLKPVSEKFEEFRKKVEESDKGRVQMQTSIEEQVKHIMSQAGKVSASADNLANALTNRSKTQGDFGELILKDILINAGLLEGIHFQCQGVMTDENGHEIKSEDGKTLIPDVQVFYPDGTTVIVDSKVSLTDYVDYCSATDEPARKAALARHIESIRKHVNELADKDYTFYLKDGKRKVDYNIMFIPNEGAYIAMLEEAPRLWQEAMGRNVLIVSQTNLVVVLNMIHMVWQQSEREKNVDAIVAAATELMDKLQKWMIVYDKMGRQITDLSKTYVDSTNRLKDSNQSVIRKVQKLESLKVSSRQKSLKATGRKTAVAAANESIIPASLTPVDGRDFPAAEDEETEN